MTGNVPPGVPESLITPQGNVPAIGIGTSQDYPRLVFSAPRFETIAIAEIIQPSVTEAVENVLPSLIPPYVDNAVLAGIQQYAVLLTGSTMSGPLFLNPLMPTADSQAATKAYVDTMLATAGIPEVPPVPVGQVWARETGQWVPISQAGGTFLPISGGSMQGNINMSGNTITNMAAVPAMPNGAAPAQWVLNQIASVSLYQGTWNADTNVPDLTQLSTHVNAYTWIALTTSPSGVVIGPAIPGLQGMTVFNGDTIIYSTVAGAFSAIHSGGITLPEADGRYVQLAGSQMSGALLLNANASQNLQAVTLQQLDAAVANTVTPDAPADGQAYLRVGVGTNRWVPGLPLAGGILTGALTLSGPGASGNNAVTVAQMNSAISGAGAGFLPIAGGTMTGALVLNGNATTNLNPVPLQQLNSMLGAYAPLSGATFTGPVTLPTGSTVAGYLPLSGGTLSGALVIGATHNLTVNGTITTAGTSAGVTFADQTTAANWGLHAAGGNGGITVPGGSFYIYSDASQETYVPVRLNVGTITTISANSAALTAVSLTQSVINTFCGQTAGGSACYVARTDNVAVAFCQFLSSTNVVGSITNLGNSTAFNTTSDSRLKTNVNPVGDSGSLVDALAPVTFNWTADPAGTPVSYGFIAQDAASIYPQAVTPGHGNPGDEMFVPYGMDNSSIMPVAIAELKSLRSRVAALEAKVP